MKYNYCIRYLKNTCILFFFLISAHFAWSQDTLLKVDKELYYRATVGGGWGKGYPFQELGNGIGGTIEFAVQKNNTVYALGARAVTEFTLFNQSNVDNTISSYDITIGRVLSKGKFFSSISAGAGLVVGLYPGELISREGGWLFGYYTYEKITYTTIGFPISVKGLWVPAKFYGLGLELYANINSRSTFYGINLCHQFGKLRPPKKKKII